MSKHIYTIEINQDDDYANACSYHIDDLSGTSRRNLREACEKNGSDRWALVALANSMEEANDKCEMIRQALCKLHDRKPYGLEDLLYEEQEDLEKKKFGD